MCDGNYYDTKYIRIGRKCYCKYCGKELKEYEDFDYHDRESTFYFHCDCEDAQKEHELNYKISLSTSKFQKELSLLNSQMPNENFNVGDFVIVDEKDNKIIKLDKKIIKL